MRFALMTEPQQGLSYAELLAVARAGEAAGFEAFFRSDHFAAFPSGATLATTDCWATLAGLARETERINLGSLVSPVTFRIPGAFLKLAMTVDEMSGGRVEIGVGAGWNQAEHEELGIPYPIDRERVDMLEEELKILTGLWNGPGGWSFEGGHWQVRDGRLSPRERPQEADRRRDGRSRPNLIVGGSGRPRSLRLAAQYADEYNVSSASAAECTDAYRRLTAACTAAGRDPRAVTRSAMVGVLIGRNEAELRDRTSALMGALGRPVDAGSAWLAERRPRWIIGTPDEARQSLQVYADAGAERIMLQDFLPRDLEHVALMGDVLVAA
jgi:alkanesulfonate monooxygenase SsuD/methylene tetrahydromethanopterin reductase-like flavin-dependent oxidoreductase (luciferase family)